jgi:hypothetical protein
VPYNAIFTFKIKIIKTKNKCILIGVVDEPKQRNERYSNNSNNAVCYYGCNGKKFPSGVKEGNGFSEG